MISKKEVQHIAKLARLGLSDKEIEKIEKELFSILDYFNLLKEVDVSDTPPAFYASLNKNVMREDKAEEKDSNISKKAFNEIPDKKDDYAKVKEVL